MQGLRTKQPIDPMWWITLIFSVLLAGCSATNKAIDIAGHAASGGNVDRIHDESIGTGDAVPLHPATMGNPGARQMRPSDVGHPSAEPPRSSGPMAVCLYEAEQLSRLGNASQKALVTGLYRNIRAAQVYSPMAQKLSPGTVSTVTPLYEFAVNDACNSVEQALLSVLKKQVPVTGGGRD